MNKYHQTVFADKAVELLQVKKKEIYIDCTVGGGGHTAGIIRLGGFVFGLDWDQEALDYSQKRMTKLCQDLGKTAKRCFLFQPGNFAKLDQLYKMEKKPSGVIFDLGVSGHQLDEPGRGFSFNHEGPLDMRMDQSAPVSAADLVNKLTPGDLQYVLTKYGDEPRAKQIALAVVAKRKLSPLRTTRELSEIVMSVYRWKRGKIHPATRTFQALRVAVNFEIDNLQEGLKQAFVLLKPGGRMVVISFQPHEDKIVKKYFGELGQQDRAEKLIKPCKPDKSEVDNNVSARSAILRAIKKTK